MKTVEDFLAPILATFDGAVVAAFALEGALASELFRRDTSDWQLARWVWRETFKRAIYHKEWGIKRERELQAAVDRPPTCDLLGQAEIRTVACAREGMRVAPWCDSYPLNPDDPEPEPNPGDPDWPDNPREAGP